MLNEFISKLRFDGRRVFLPPIKLDPGIFNRDVKRPLNNIGGTWDSALQCFEFPFDPRGRIEDLKLGIKIKLSSQYHFFETNIDLVGHMFMFCQESGINWEELDQETSRVLEPGAGRGNILKVLNVKGFKKIFYYELMPENVEVTEGEIKRLNIPAFFLGNDFLKGTESNFDLIVANPPFRNEKKHITQMTKVLKHSGILMTLGRPQLYNDGDFITFMNSNFSRWEMRLIESDPEDPIFIGTDIGCTIIVGRKRHGQMQLF